MIGGRALTGTSMSRHATARRCRSVARPPAARTFWTQLQRSPSIGTRYHWPSRSAIPSGKRTARPDRRPATSRVTQRSGASPRAKTPAHRRAKRRAVLPARAPGYMARSSSSEKGQMPITSSCVPMSRVLGGTGDGVPAVLVP